MRESIVYIDEAGNRLVDDGRRIGVRNNQGKLVTRGEFENFIDNYRKMNITKHTAFMPRKIATPKDLVNAGLILRIGGTFGAFIPFKKLKHYKIKLKGKAKY